MREGSIIKFLHALDCENIDTKGAWVQSTCPLAPYTHGGGEDTRPSFGVAINNEEESIWYCFGCSPKGQRLGKLLHTLWVASGRYPQAAAKVLLHEENHGLGKKRKLPEIWAEERVVIAPLPVKVLQRYPLLPVHGRLFEEKRVRDWLWKERLIDPLIFNMCRVRIASSDSAVVFPLTNVGGRIFVLRFRSRKSKSMWTADSKIPGLENVVFPKLKDVGVWFGMSLVDWEVPILLTEGEIDAMRAMTLGFLNTLASATSSVTDAQIDALPLRSGPLFLGYDADKAGEHAHKRIFDRLKGKVPIYELDWSVAGVNDGGAIKRKEDLWEVLKRKRSIS